MSAEAPVGQLFSQLVEDGKAYAKAEVELAKAKATEKVQPYKSAAIFGGAAYVLAHAAVVAFLVGLILSIEPELGPFGATIVVVLVTLAVAAILGYLAYRRAVGGTSR